MNWRLSQPSLIACVLLACASVQADPVSQIDNQPPGNNPAAALPPGTNAAAPPADSAPPAVAAPPAADSTPTAAPPPASGTASPIPVPTDQTPPVVPLPSPIPLGEKLLVSGAVDGRYRTSSTGRSDQGWLNDAEVDLNRPLDYNGQPIGDVRLQVVAENPPDISHGQDVQVGEAYVLYKLPFQTQTDSTAYLKFGQFQLPFGLLAVYDPHLQILQPLYQQSLGLRTDFGLAASGRFYGLVNYDIALTTGAGPDHIDSEIGRVVTFRLGRTFVTRNGTVNVGGSLLQGRMPDTDISAANPLPFEVAPSGYVRADRGTVSKTRIAGDGTLTFKGLLARGEAMTGADQNSRVEGYFAEIDYKFSPHASVLGARSVWDYPANDSLTNDNAIGLTYAPSANLSFSALYEDFYNIPANVTGKTMHRFTVQALLRF